MQYPGQIGSRIETFLSYIDDEGQKSMVWDLCCDHGKIGTWAYLQNKSRIINFNDKEKHLIEKLKEIHLNQFSLESASFNYYSAKANELKISNIINNHSKIESCYFVIAGIGGHNAINILEKNFAEINKTNFSKELKKIRFILSPQSSIKEFESFCHEKQSLKHWYLTSKSSITWKKSAKKNISVGIWVFDVNL